jgi:hypothetical protein
MDVAENATTWRGVRERYRWDGDKESGCKTDARTKASPFSARHGERRRRRDKGRERARAHTLARVRRLRSARRVGRRALLVASALAPRRTRSPRLPPCARVLFDAPGCSRPAVVVAFLLDDTTMAFPTAVTRSRPLCSLYTQAASSPTRASTHQTRSVSRSYPMP